MCIVGALLLQSFFVFHLEGGLPGLTDILIILIKYIYVAVVSYCHQAGVNPHCQIAGKDSVEKLCRQATVVSGLANDRVHVAVYSYASVLRPFERFFRIPVILVSFAERIN